jgi:hypothetical protein
MNFRVIENEKTVDIVFTDIQLHVVKPRKPIPLSRAIEKSVRSGRLGRAFTNNFSIEENGKFSISFPTPPELEKVTADAKRRGKTVRYILPEGGIPVFAGKDMIENLISKMERRHIEKNT